MAIKFRNIDSGETLAIDPTTDGPYYHAKLSAVINSSNMGENRDRGQDYGWRLDEEQQALIEMWEQDGSMIDRVSQHVKVPVDSLSHGDFLVYLVYQQGLGTSPERREVTLRREREAEYQARVQSLRDQQTPEPVAPFKAPTVEQFMNGELTGDASGDKVVDVTPVAGTDYDEKSTTPVEVATETLTLKAPKKK